MSCTHYLLTGTSRTFLQTRGNRSRSRLPSVRLRRSRRFAIPQRKPSDRTAIVSWVCKTPRNSWGFGSKLPFRRYSECSVLEGGKPRGCQTVTDVPRSLNTFGEQSSPYAWQLDKLPGIPRSFSDAPSHHQLPRSVAARPSFQWWAFLAHISAPRLQVCPLGWVAEYIIDSLPLSDYAAITMILD